MKIRREIAVCGSRTETVEVDIDVDAIVDNMGWRATQNETGIAREIGGLVEARVIKVKEKPA